MSKFYATNNRESSKDLFEKRVIYRSDASNTNYENLVDFNFGEKFLYGRVNRFFVPIEEVNILPLSTSMKTFKRSADPKKALSALSFVVDAFEQVARQFEKCAQLRKIDTKDPFLTNLRVHRAYDDHRVLYRNHAATYQNALQNIFVDRNIKVKGFDHFIDELMSILQNTAHRNAFTKTAFIKSRRCPATCSGLVIEIADLDAANDEEKINQFVNSLNWEFYLQTCASYGFMVDKNVPWRMVADIGSEPHRSAIYDYAEKYGYSTTNQILSSIYQPVHRLYFYAFKKQLLQVYNAVKLKSFLEPQECPDGTLGSKKIIPHSYTLESLSEKYTEFDFMRWYMQIRFAEEESEFSENERQAIVDSCLDLSKGSYKYDDLYIQGALNAFERILNKTFDYNGSLSYISKRVKLIKDGLDDQQGNTRGSNAFSGY